MEPVQTNVQPKPRTFSPARVAVFYIAVAVLSITVCTIAAAFAVVGHELNYTLMREHDRGTPFLSELGMGIGAILGLAAAIIWCRRILALERASNPSPTPIISAVVLALLATVVLHLSLMFLQAYLRCAPLNIDGLGVGAIVGIPAALISGAILGVAGDYVLVGDRS